MWPTFDVPMHVSARLSMSCRVAAAAAAVATSAAAAAAAEAYSISPPRGVGCPVPLLPCIGRSNIRSTAVRLKISAVENSCEIEDSCSGEQL